MWLSPGLDPSFQEGKQNHPPLLAGIPHPSLEYLWGRLIPGPSEGGTWNQHLSKSRKTLAQGWGFPSVPRAPMAGLVWIFKGSRSAGTPARWSPLTLCSAHVRERLSLLRRETTMAAPDPKARRLPSDSDTSKGSEQLWTLAPGSSTCSPWSKCPRTGPQARSPAPVLARQTAGGWLKSSPRRVAPSPAHRVQPHLTAGLPLRTISQQSAESQGRR